MMDPIFFQTSAEFRDWLEKNHATAGELWVGFYKKGSGRPSITWPESVDEALCYGWIDSIRKSIDEVSYQIRFTPRKPGGIWSRVNIERSQELIEQGRMQPAGLVVYQTRKENIVEGHSYDQRREELEEPYNQMLKENEAAWSYFQSQPPYYRKVVGWWIISAKKEETRLRRLEKLIVYSARGQKLPEVTLKKE